jgi:hypothetical protein
MKLKRDRIDRIFQIPSPGHAAENQLSGEEI